MTSKPSSRQTRPEVEELLALDRSVLGWARQLPPGWSEVRDVPLDAVLRKVTSGGVSFDFEGVPRSVPRAPETDEAGRGALPRSACPMTGVDKSATGMDEAGRGATPRSADPMIGMDEAGCGATPRSAYPMVGMDEAGRGALAGPVTVGCVSLPLASLDADSLLLRSFRGLGDSKKIAPKTRARLFEAIAACAAWSVGCASAREVDQLGIVAACSRAARRALVALQLPAGEIEVLFLDRGLHLDSRAPGGSPRLPKRQVTLTRADAQSLHVSAASIMAKVWRDRWMCGIDGRVPGFAFAQHKGYGTAAHRAAIAHQGLSRIHRRSFLGSLEASKSQSC